MSRLPLIEGESPDRRLPVLASYPTGWFHAVWSGEVPQGEVRTLKYFGKEYICFRGEGGEVGILDAHCLHMGAHLGYGGKVEGDSIRCAFHGWCWGLDGANVDIPYGKRRRTGLSLGHHVVHEADGIIYMWHDALGRGPLWDPPMVSKFIDPSTCYNIYPDCADEDSLRLVPQMVIENIIDFVHLKWAHGWDAGEPEMLGYEFDGHTFLGRMRGFLHTKRGDVTVDVANHLEGIGVILAPMSGIRDMLQGHLRHTWRLRELDRTDDDVRHPQPGPRPG